MQGSYSHNICPPYLVRGGLAFELVRDDIPDAETIGFEEKKDETGKRLCLTKCRSALWPFGGRLMEGESRRPAAPYLDRSRWRNDVQGLLVLVLLITSSTIKVKVRISIMFSEVCEMFV